MNKKYDVIIVGAGPAGGQAARNLAKKGYKVLLTDRIKEYQQNNFSSAGMTLDPMSEFDLPEKVIGTYWKGITIQCSKNKYHWQSKNKKGVVLDFGKLRQFLAEDAINNGADVLLGYKYVSKLVNQESTIVEFLDVENNKINTIETKLLIDATGPLRKVMFDEKVEQPEMMLGSGTEYLIEVDQKTYDNFKDKLVFFLGHKWSIKGYSWIFPMENKILKVGAGKTQLKTLNQEKTNKTTKTITEKIIEEYIRPEKYKILDKHGGIIRYSRGLKDVFYQNKVIGVGDAVSAINPRGGEGIRYAMQSADLACNYIDEYLKTGKDNFKNYRKIWRKRKWFKWKLSELSAGRMYSRYTDDQVENRVAFFYKNFTIDDLIDSLFYFKYGKVVSRFYHYFILKIKFLIKNEKF